MKTGQIYVASSWRNGNQPLVIRALRAEGFDCYDFKNPEEGDHGFSWKQVAPPGMNGTPDHKHGDEWEPRRIIETLKHPIAERGFELDYSAMERSWACVMVMPCGRSAHLEAGYFAGARKPLHVLLAEPCEPELMWKLAHVSGGAIHYQLSSVVRMLREASR